MRKKLVLLFFISSSSFFIPVDAQNYTVFKTWKLKGGYRLIIEGNNKDSTLLVIKKARPGEPFGRGESTMFLDASEPKFGLDIYGYVFKDFDNCYVMAHHHDADPIKIEIIDKAKGATMIWGKTPFYTDTVKQFMLFEGMYGKAGKIILYNFLKEKYELFKSPTDTRCFCCGCWKFVSLTDAEMKIEYINLEGQSVVKTYVRDKG